MARKEALEVDRLTVTFAREGRTVVRSVSFTIASGEA
jgi:ABC-type glutathione transport system ATPase component